MGEPGDETTFESKQAFEREIDPEGDPNVARYDSGVWRAMVIQRLDRQNELLQKLASAIAQLAKASKPDNTS